MLVLTQPTLAIRLTLASTLTWTTSVTQPPLSAVLMLVTEQALLALLALLAQPMELPHMAPAMSDLTTRISTNLTLVSTLTPITATILLPPWGAHALAMATPLRELHQDLPMPDHTALTS
jgi:hypothetical protein